MAHDGHCPCAYFFPTLNSYGDSEFEFAARLTANGYLFCVCGACYGGLPIK